MAHIEKSIHIDAPVEAVFEYSGTIATIPEWYTSMIEVRNASGPRAAAGVKYDWTFKMAGARFDGKAEFTEVVPNDHTRSRTEGGIPSQWHWRYAREQEGTRVTATVDYTVPGSLLGKLMDMLFIERRNERDLEHALENLKAHCEVAAKALAKA